ncbi:unnamed protein product [Prunus armeniaca]
MEFHPVQHTLLSLEQILPAYQYAKSLFLGVSRFNYSTNIWDVASGDELYTFEAPVVCGDIQVFNRYIHLRIMEFLPLGCLLELLGSDQKG